ncbi:MAG: hypothetical protein IKA76_01740 [Clostridia bacterium]|nr:hypothetical protein [Clostridia bacterium]
MKRLFILLAILLLTVFLVACDIKITTDGSDKNTDGVIDSEAKTESDASQTGDESDVVGRETDAAAEATETLGTEISSGVGELTDLDDYWHETAEISRPDDTMSQRPDDDFLNDNDVSAIMTDRVDVNAPSGEKPNDGKDHPTEKAIQIRTVEDLRRISGNGNYILENDIDLGGIQWEPINNFHGWLDGNGFVISNFFVEGEYEYAGFFGRGDATVSNLGLENFTIDVRATVGEMGEPYCDAGGLAGRNGGEITNCYAIGEVFVRGKGMINSGVLVGQNYGEINRCWSDGMAFVLVPEDAEDAHEALINAAGLVSETYAPLTDCYTNASVRVESQSVKGTRIAVGGLVGECYENLLRCYATGAVEVSVYYEEGLAEAIDVIQGGLVGVNYAERIEACLATGNIHHFYHQIGDDMTSPETDTSVGADSMDEELPTVATDDPMENVPSYGSDVDVKEEDTEVSVDFVTPEYNSVISTQNSIAIIRPSGSIDFNQGVIIRPNDSGLAFDTGVTFESGSFEIITGKPSVTEPSFGWDTDTTIGDMIITPLPMGRVNMAPLIGQHYGSEKALVNCFHSAEQQMSVNDIVFDRISDGGASGAEIEPEVLYERALFLRIGFSERVWDFEESKLPTLKK